MIGDCCLIYAGLNSEHAATIGVPIAYLAQVGSAAYRQFSELARDPVFELLSDYFVDVIGVLHGLREIEEDRICMDPLNAFQLWEETGSVHAWRTLRRFTSSLPGEKQELALH